MRAAVRWTRGDGQPLPAGSRDRNGRLEIPNVQLNAAGIYICEAVDYPKTSPGQNSAVVLKVEPGLLFFLIFFLCKIKLITLGFYGISLAFLFRKLLNHFSIFETFRASEFFCKHFFRFFSRKKIHLDIFNFFWVILTALIFWWLFCAIKIFFLVIFFVFQIVLATFWGAEFFALFGVKILSS